MNNKKTTKEDIEFFYSYLDKLGVEYTVDNNPSEEKIKYIKERIEADRKFSELSREIANHFIGNK